MQVVIITTRLNAVLADQSAREKEADEITKRLLELVAKDAEVFEPLS